MAIAGRNIDERLGKQPLEPISKLAPFSALIISITLVMLFLIRYYVMENFLIRRLYGSIYSDMSELNRRGFINHHIAGTTKIVILIVAAYPFVSIISGNASLHTPFVRGSAVVMGDILVVAAQILIAMYIFELLYRVKLSPVAVMHHIGTIMIGQSAIAISFNLAREPDADIEFILCTVWGRHLLSLFIAPFRDGRPVLSSLSWANRMFRRFRYHLRILPPYRHYPVPYLPKSTLFPATSLPLLVSDDGNWDRN